MNNENRKQNAIKLAFDEHGLRNGVNYIFKDNGYVDWRAMIDRKHLFPNEKWFVDNKKPVPETAEGLSDEQCIISLAGFKELLSLRGYIEQRFDVVSSVDHAVTVKCHINFTPNYETNMLACSREEVATADIFNVNESFKPYMHTIAANRALCRTVRNFLNINIVSKEEIGDNSAIETSSSASDISKITPLSLILKDGFTEEQIRAVCIANNLNSSWENVSYLDEDRSLGRKVQSLLKKQKK